MKGRYPSPPFDIILSCLLRDYDLGLMRFVFVTQVEKIVTTQEEAEEENVKNPPKVGGILVPH